MKTVRVSCMRCLNIFFCYNFLLFAKKGMSVLLSRQGIPMIDITSLGLGQLTDENLSSSSPISSYNTVERPYKVPLGTVGCCIFITPPSLICIYLLLVASKMTYVYFSILSICGVLFVWLQKFAKHYGWVEYAQPPPKRRKSSAAPKGNGDNDI